MLSNALASPLGPCPQAYSYLKHLYRILRDAKTLIGKDLCCCLKADIPSSTKRNPNVSIWLGIGMSRKYHASLSDVLNSIVLDNLIGFALFGECATNAGSLVTFNMSAKELLSIAWKQYLFLLFSWIIT